MVSGDYLERIAKKNQVTISQLKEWNQLSSTTLMPGQKLVVYTAATQAPDQQATASRELAPIDPEAENKATASLGTKNHPKAPAAPISQEVKLIHAVQPGDTLYNISKRYNNIPVERIKKLNKLKSDEIKPGQKLVIS